jgi:hypothetical protein
MRPPQLVDYQLAMQAPSIAFIDATLRRSQPRRTPLGLPSLASGGFALTFDVRVDGRRYAIRCFHKQGNHLQERYASIAGFVRTARWNFLVDVDYLSQGIRVGDTIHPIIRMQWVEGNRLDDWIDDHLYEPSALRLVRQNIADAVTALRQSNAAHGDLQHGNILVLPDRTIKLIDYDGMYLPALRQYGAAEQGNRNYQHPDRTAQYDESLDLFAAAVIDLSLTALAEDPTLWKEYNQNSGERLIFSAGDFASPSTSSLFNRLSRIPTLATPALRLQRACETEIADLSMTLTGTASTTAPRRRADTAAPPPSRLIMRATERTRLLAHQGDEVTVVGRIHAVKMTNDRRGKLITFLNFGEFRLGAFTIVAWDRAGRDLNRTLGDPARLVGNWVTLTGLLTVYQRPNARHATPQIELRSARTLRVITAHEAEKLLGNPDPQAQTPTTHRSTTQPSRPTSSPSTTTTPTSAAAGRPPAHGAGGNTTSKDALDDRLSRLYSSPTFAARLTTAQTTTTTSAPGSPSPPATPQPQTARTTPQHGGPRPGPPWSPPPQQPWTTTPPPRPAPPPIPSYPPYPHPPGRPPMPARPGLGTHRPPPPDLNPGVGVAAILTAIFVGPAGVVLALIVLSRGRNQARADTICAAIALVIGIVWTIAALASAIGQ